MKYITDWTSIAFRAVLGVLLLAAVACSEGATDDSASDAATVGDACTSDDDCGGGMVCGTANGACFGGARSDRRCWPTRCYNGVEPSSGDCGQADSPCGPVCSCATECDVPDESPCPPGEACISNFGRILGIESRHACGDPVLCPSNDPPLCGALNSLCGPNCICTPDCSQATSSNTGDGCGGLCPDVCPIGLKGCCTQDFECAGNGVCLLDPDGAPTCRPAECFARVLVPPLCGTPDALCGPDCPVCTPRCDGKTCGPDPNCGMSCGTCGDSGLCDTAQQCQACVFELALQGGLVEPRVSTETAPTPGGGLLPEATFDLSDIVVYGQAAPAPSARREAFRFFDGGQAAEYVVEVPGDTTELPRQIVSVTNSANFSQLAFFKSCPHEWEETSTSFVRGYTVTDSELLLFDATSVFVYSRR